MWDTATRRFKKALIERAVGAELSHHLGYAPGTTQPERTTIIATERAARPCDRPVPIEVPRNREGSVWHGPQPQSSQRVRTFQEGQGWQLAAGVPFAVMPDGKRFLMVRYESAAIPTRIDDIFNWFDELKRKIP
jgi:hypothetical protein